jgi:hypothetical protein
MTAAARVTVTNVATKVAENTASTSKIDASDDYRAVTVTLKNVTGGQVFLGDATVTAGSGWQWDGEVLELPLEPGEQLWAVVAAGSQSVHVFRNGR